MEIISQERFLHAIEVLLKNVKDEEEVSKALSKYFNSNIYSIGASRSSEYDEIINLLEYCINDQDGVISYMLHDLGWVYDEIDEIHENCTVNEAKCLNWKDFYNIISITDGKVYSISNGSWNHIFY